MIPFKDLLQNQVITAGSILRLYGVKRFDVIKTIDDRKDSQKREKDYYDLMIVDASILTDGSYLLVNITTDSGNKGKVFGLMENIQTNGYITASALQKYFDPNVEAYLL